MHQRIRPISAMSVLAAGALSVGVLQGSVASAQPSSHAAAAMKARVPTVVAHMGDKAIHLSTGHRLHAGRVMFKVVTQSGGHTLQLLRLHKGYTLREAGADFNKAFRGDLDAIHRLDHRITFLGGANARPDKPGGFAVTLHASRLVVVDQNSDAVTRLRVFGKVSKRPTVPTSSHITTFTYGFGVSEAVLPASGWTRVSNVSDQPHFVVFQRVKESTTKRQVRRFIHRGAHGNPPWALKANTDVGVISPNRGEAFKYDLPPGKYVLACFWPDDETGMPHFFMGMWTLVHLS